MERRQKITLEEIQALSITLDDVYAKLWIMRYNVKLSAVSKNRLDNALNKIAEVIDVLNESK